MEEGLVDAYAGMVDAFQDCDERREALEAENARLRAALGGVNLVARALLDTRPDMPPSIREHVEAIEEASRALGGER